MKTNALALAIGLAMSSQVAHAAVSLDWATVGNAGNGVDPLSFGFERGAVAYSYLISKYEVTNAQYTEFLNAVDPAGANTLGLFNPQMSTHGNGGIDFDGDAASGSKYQVKSGRANNPVVFVSFKDSLRFTNWLENGQGSGSTETGAYTITGGNAEVRSSSATYFLPSPDEWHKAAFHKNDGVTSNYWLYPTSAGTLDLGTFTADTPFYSARPPGSAAPEPSNSANIFRDDVDDLNGYDDGYAVTGSPIQVDGQNYLTDVGAYAASVSPYGTFDQAGNVSEWTDTIHPDFLQSRSIFGGAYDNNWVESYSSVFEIATAEAPTIGFRVASAVPVPEPMQVSLLALGCLVLLLRAKLSVIRLAVATKWRRGLRLAGEDSAACLG